MVLGGARQRPISPAFSRGGRWTATGVLTSPVAVRMRGLFPGGRPRRKNIRSSSSTRPPINEAGE
jgi:hypothetical protein